ncbi:MAG: zinc-dependent alcohol dehydrogenase family protein [Nitrospiraceae bacterium]|nr:zinc-dependent alcohol dehydrogenase family protein [Nitrospiraceae bacterium]
MRAMVLKKISDFTKNKSPLEPVLMEKPVPGPGQILVRVSRCGVCHTDLDVIEGRTPPPRFPVIPGHQVIGRVEERGQGASKHNPDDRVGIAWIYSACGRCRFCLSGMENLCEDFRATGRDANGGYAEYVAVSEDFAYPIPDVFSDSEAAPLLCAGAVGYRSVKLAGITDGESVGLMGFGAAGHLVLAVIRHRYPNSRVFVFSRTPGERDFAKELGAFWAGDIPHDGKEEGPPEKLRLIIDTTPVWGPVVAALGCLEKAGRLVINAIRKEEADKRSLLDLDYSRDLWMEKEIKSVANVTRADLEEFLPLAAGIPIRPEVREYPLEDANQALLEIKERKIRGAKVLKIR